jgi:hypothetical protein
MGGKAQFRNGYEYHYDDATSEALLVVAPIVFTEDFLGAGHDAGVPVEGTPVAGYPWVKRLVKTAGAPAVAIVANAPGGQMGLSIDVTDEKQEATLYQNDQLTWDSTKTLFFQARLKFTTLPTAAGVEAVWGLQSAWVDGPDNATEYLGFGINGAGGEVVMRAQDGVSQRAINTGFVADNNFHLYRIEIDAAGVVHFYIDGVEYSTSVNPVTWGGNAVLQLYASLYKATGAGDAVADIDAIEAWSPRT